MAVVVCLGVNIRAERLNNGHYLHILQPNDFRMRCIVADYDPTVTRRLADLREAISVSQSQAARFFGLKDKKGRDSVSAWETGKAQPARKRRPDFIVYLTDVLGLRTHLLILIETWNAVMVGQWGWPPLSENELTAYFPGAVLTAKEVGGRALELTFANGHHAVMPFLAPSPAPSLVGRSTEVDQLKVHLFSGGSMATLGLVGLPGVGKSGLAIALAHDPELQAHFRDGILWAPLGPKNPNPLVHLGIWALALGLTGSQIENHRTIDERQSLLRACIGMRRMLLVVDDAWSAEAAEAFRVGGPNCAYLLTSRQRSIIQEVTGKEPYLVKELSPAASMDLLKQLAPRAVIAEPQLARELIRRSGGLPQALKLYGTQIRRQPEATQSRYLKRLLENLAATEEQEAAERIPQPLSVAIQTSVGALEHAAREALYALATFPPKPASFSEEAALAVAGSHADILSAIYDFGLLEVDSGRYMLHQTVSDWAATRLADMTAHMRFVEHFAGYIREHQECYDRLDDETSNVLAALSTADRFDMRVAMVSIATQAADFFASRGLYAALQPHLERARSLAAAQADCPGEITALIKLAMFAERQGQYGVAQEYLTPALELTSQPGYVPQRLQVLAKLGVVNVYQGEIQSARALWIQGLKAARDVSADANIVAFLTNLAVLADMEGDYDAEADLYAQALPIARLGADPKVLCPLLQGLAVLFLNRGQYESAHAHILESLANARAIGDPRGTSHVLSSLGAIAYYSGLYLQADEAWTEARQLAQTAAVPQLIAANAANLGELRAVQGRFSEAEQLILEGVRLNRDIDNGEGLLYALAALGSFYAMRGRLAEARPVLKDGLRRARRLKHTELVCALLQAYGIVFLKTGDLRRANVRLQRAVALAKQLKHQWHICESLTALGDLHLAEGLQDAAAKVFREALRSADEIGVPAPRAFALFGIARASGITNSPDAREALRVFEQLGHHGQNTVREWMNRTE